MTQWMGMARGWESKSVESQMEAAESRRAAAQQGQLDAGQVRLTRERESLMLSRTRVMRELAAASHERHRRQLQAALDHLEAQLKQLNGDI